MFYKEHKPVKPLGQYVKCYYSLEYEHGSEVVDYAFATGCLEVMFMLDGQPWETKVNEGFRRTSAVEVWGQIVQPLQFRVPGYSKVFGIRFHPAAASVLMREDISLFNNRVLDLTTVIGNPIAGVHAQLQDAASTDRCVQIMDAFLLKNVSVQSKAFDRIDLVQKVMNELSGKDFFDNIENVAERHGITARYLQKIFVQQTGLTPKLYAKINRFQNSLVLLGRQDQSLTSVAYSSGYFDQSHFIREFKSFTGFSPSRFKPAASTAILASPNK